MVAGKAASSEMVKGATPVSSSSRATRMAKASESKPVSCRDRSSVSSGSVTCCSMAICLIASITLDLVDMAGSHLLALVGLSAALDDRLPYPVVYRREVNGFLDNSGKIGGISVF